MAFKTDAQSRKIDPITGELLPPHAPMGLETLNLKIKAASTPKPPPPEPKQVAREPDRDYLPAFVPQENPLPILLGQILATLQRIEATLRK
jgi:hypothetical protein